MPFTAISSTEVESGKPVTTVLFGKVKDDLDDHEERLQTVESGVGTTYPPIILGVSGRYDTLGAVAGIVKTTLNFPIQITGVRLLSETAGISGTTEIDIKYKRGVAAFTSILNTLPSLAYTAGNDAISSNGVLNPSHTTLQAGDILALDITSVQSEGNGFYVRIDYTGA